MELNEIQQQIIARQFRGGDDDCAKWALYIMNSWCHWMRVMPGINHSIAGSAALLKHGIDATLQMMLQVPAIEPTEYKNAHPGSSSIVWRIDDEVVWSYCLLPGQEPGWLYDALVARNKEKE